MSILETVPSTIAAEDRHRVKAIAEAILQHQGDAGEDLLELVISESPITFHSGAKEKAERAVELAAVVVNYMRAEFAEACPERELLRALQREAGL